MGRSTSATILALALLVALPGCGQERPAESARQADPAALAAKLEQLRAAQNAGLHEATVIYAQEIVQRFPASAEARQLSGELPALRATAEQQREDRRLSELWVYHAVEVEGGTQYTAYIDGHTDQASAPSLRLVLRRHPEWGQNVYLLVGEGTDFGCADNCDARLEFDDGPARGWELSRAEDTDPPAVFVEDDTAFFEAIASASVLRLSLPLAGDRVVDYRFEVGGYDPARMLPDNDADTSD